MSKDQSVTAAAAGPGGAGPLLRILGDADAAVCVDGFCEVPVQPVLEATPGDDGSHE
jgi:hypothetical protein